MPPLRILILSDGRPGHYHLSEGIAAAAARRRPVAITKLTVTRGRWPGTIAAALCSSPVAGEGVLKLLSGHAEPEFPQADVVISAGAETLPANVLLARLRKIPNIFYGSLRRYRSEDFSLVMTSYERNAGRPRHALALKPSAADPDQIRPSRPTGQHRPDRLAGLLVGGNSGTFTYEPSDWTRLLSLVVQTHAVTGTRWLVSNSRRTDPVFSDTLAKLAAAPDSPIARLIDVRTAGAGSLHEIFEHADVLAVTDDSSSMISEAIWMRLPVVGLRAAASSHPSDEQIYRAWLERSGWCRTLVLDEATPASLLSAWASVRPLETNPLDRLAGLLAERLPALFPQTSP